MKDLRDLKDFDDTRCKTFKRPINRRAPAPHGGVARLLLQIALPPPPVRPIPLLLRRTPPTPRHLHRGLRCCRKLCRRKLGASRAWNVRGAGGAVAEVALPHLLLFDERRQRPRPPPRRSSQGGRTPFGEEKSADCVHIYPRGKDTIWRGGVLHEKRITFKPFWQ